MGNLRQISLALHMYANDNDGVVLLYTTGWGGYGDPYRWAMHIIGRAETAHAYLPPNPNLWLCPTGPSGFDAGGTNALMRRTYGHLYFDQWPDFIETGGTPNYRSVRMLHVRQPYHFIHLVDSLDASNRQPTDWRPATAASGYIGNIHTRHGNTANVTFLDGRVESADRQKLYDTTGGDTGMPQITRTFDQEGVVRILP